MADEKVTFQIAAKDKATATVKRLRGELNTLGGTAGRAAGPMGKLSAVTGGLVSPVILGVAAVGALTAGFLGAARAAMDEERGVALLTTAIEQNDGASLRNLDAIEAVITERQKLAFADDEQRESLGALVAITRDSSKALELQRTAMDLARLKGMSLAAASTLLGKVYGGNLGILARYGIILEEGATSTEALAEIQRRASGQAEAYAATTAGSMESMQLAFDDVVEEIGAMLLPALTSFAVWMRDEGIPAIRDFLGEVGELIQGFIDVADGVADMARTAAIWMGNMGQTIEDRANEIGVSVYDMKVLVQSGMNEMNMTFEEATAAAERELLGLPPIMTQAGIDVVNAALAGRPGMRSAAEAVAGEMPAAMTAAQAEAERIAAQTPGEMAAALTSGLEAWKKSWEGMENAAILEQQKGRRIRNNLARLHSAEITEALASGDAGRIAWAQQVQIDLTNALDIDGYQYGINVTKSYRDGLNAGYGWVRDAAGNLAAAVRGQIGINSEPSDPSSPLRGITRWGGNIGTTIADDMRRRGVAAIRGAAGALAGGVLMPSMGGAMAYAGHGGSMGGSVSIVVNPPPYWSPSEGQRFARALTPELVRELRRQGV